MTDAPAETKIIPVRYDFPGDIHEKLTKYQRIMAVLLDRPLTQEQAIIHMIKHIDLPPLKD